QHEYFHAFRTPCSYTVLLMDLTVDGSIDTPELYQPTPHQVLEVVRRISEVKRHNDIIAQYDGGGIAFLLPSTTTAGAKAFAKRVIKILKSSPLPGLNKENKLSVTIGIATMPQDCKVLGEMLAAAEIARDYARQTRVSHVAYADVV